MRLTLIASLLAALLVFAPTRSSLAQQDHTNALIESVKQINEQDNGLIVSLKGGYVDVDAKVCLREGEFLEMFACTPDSKEHESILVLQAKPSMIHLGLLLLGAEPGRPLSYDHSFDPPKLVPAVGPEVGVYVVIDIAGKDREIPANRWVQDTTTQKMMEGNSWLFVGSVTREIDGNNIYLADVTGSAISLVNFGDDLLTKPNEMTLDNASHGKVWAPRTRAIPKVGTEVRLRLRPKRPAKAEDEPKDQTAEGDSGGD